MPIRGIQSFFSFLRYLANNKASSLTSISIVCLSPTFILGTSTIVSKCRLASWWNSSFYLLSVAAKLLAQISGRDKYNRQWLGLLFILAIYEMNHINLSPKQAKAEISDQWKEDITFLPDQHLINYKQIFDEILLSWYLSNIANESRKTWNCWPLMTNNQISS